MRDSKEGEKKKIKGLMALQGPRRTPRKLLLSKKGGSPTRDKIS